MELKTYFTILARRWPIILVVTLVTALLAIAYTRKYTSYEAEASLQIITPIGGSMDYIYSDTTFADRLMNTTVQIATSDQLKKDLQDKLNLTALPAISVKTIPDSEIIQIIVDGRDPTLVAKTANALAELIISNQDTVVANSTISNEIDLLNNRKAELETALAQDQQKYDTIVLTYSQTAAKLSTLDGTIQMDKASYQNLLDQYQRSLLTKDTGQTAILNTELNDQEKILASLNQQYQDISTNSNTYSEQILMARQTIQNDQSAYSTLLTQYDTVLSAQSREDRSHSIQIVSPASVPTKPTLSSFFVVLLGLMCGLVGGIVIAFIVDNLDTRILTSEQAEAMTTMPVLGGFPHLRKEDVQKGNMPLALQGDSLILRKQIFTAFQSIKARTVLVTSPNAMEGKSTILAYLASILAENGSKVLIVDTNLRRPQQNVLYSISDGPDIGTLLRDEGSTLNDVIRKNVKPGVDLLPCLTAVNDPAELLHSSQLKILFKKNTYDYILFDSPALLAVPDGYTLAQLVDGVLIVIQRESTTKGDIQSTSRYLDDIGTKLLGIVINQMPTKMDINLLRPEKGLLNRIRINAKKFIPERP
jgi:capsular exopolysaccharide synthesis family protein